MASHSTPDLESRRYEAARAAAGMSADTILTMFLAQAKAMKLQGEALDFGAGRGNLSRIMLDAGLFSGITAIDLMPPDEDLPKSIRWLTQDLNEPIAALPDGSFDVIMASEVIEHLENPRAIAREWFRLLRPGGTLLASTPNNESWRALIHLTVRGHFAAFNEGSYPAHITALVRKDFERILNEVGFASPRFVFTNEGGLPAKPSVTWQQVTGGMLKGMRFSDNVLAIAIKPKN